VHRSRTRWWHILLCTCPFGQSQPSSEFIKLLPGNLHLSVSLLLTRDVPPYFIGPLSSINANSWLPVLHCHPRTRRCHCIQHEWEQLETLARSLYKISRKAGT
jgi:hypothetical protein